jgi:hypothetical protein
MTKQNQKPFTSTFIVPDSTDLYILASVHGQEVATLVAKVDTDCDVTYPSGKHIAEQHQIICDAIVDAVIIQSDNYKLN